MAFLDNTGLERVWSHIIQKIQQSQTETISVTDNILDNSNFQKLITYRAGYVETIEQSGELARHRDFDRWETSTNITEYQGHGLSFPSGASTLTQGFPLNTIRDEKYTFVATLENSSRIGGVLDLTSVEQATITFNNFTVVLTKQYNSTYDKLEVKCNLSSETVIKSMGLYRGEFTTLPVYQDKGSTLERINCLRYFRRINSISTAGWSTSNNLRVVFPVEVPLRIETPILHIKEAGTIRGLGKSVTTTTPTLGNIGASDITINISSSSGTGSGMESTALTTNETYAWVGGQIGLDADFY